MTETEALAVEAALIDLIELGASFSLTNIVGGHHSRERGWKSVDEIMVTYDAKPAEILEPSILVIINRLYQREMSAERLYEVTRGNWVIGSRRDLAKYVFAVSNGLIRQVHEVEKWYSIDAGGSAKIQKRWRFDGHIAENMQHYVNGSVEDYITVGAQNPIKYVNC